MSCCLVVNSLSTNIDPHQTSPYNIIAQSNEQGKRVNGIISTDEMSCSAINKWKTERIIYILGE